MEKYCPKCFKKYPVDQVVCPADGSNLVAPMEKGLTGEVIDNRYTVLEQIGRGGMGVVYRAEQQLIKRTVALKVLRREVIQDESAVRRFLTEAQAIASLDSRYTVTLYDFGVTSDGLLYYTMELLKGQTLSRLIRLESGLPLERSARLVLQICDSLKEAHERGILHRDLKPDNLFVVERDGREAIKVLDFGIAKLVGDSSGESVTRTGVVIGTPQYVSPEQALGNAVGHTSDLYSLAVVFYEMLAGVPPFQGETPMKTMWAHIRDPYPPIGSRSPAVRVPASVERFLARALAKEPGARYPSVVAFRDGLREALGESDEVSRSAPSTILSSTEERVGLSTQAWEKQAAPGRTALSAQVMERSGESEEATPSGSPDALAIEDSIMLTAEEELSSGNPQGGGAFFWMRNGWFVGGGAALAAAGLFALLWVWSDQEHGKGTAPETPMMASADVGVQETLVGVPSEDLGVEAPDAEHSVDVRFDSDVQEHQEVPEPDLSQPKPVSAEHVATRVVPPPEPPAEIRPASPLQLAPRQLAVDAVAASGASLGGNGGRAVTPKEAPEESRRDQERREAEVHRQPERVGAQKVAEEERRQREAEANERQRQREEEAGRAAKREAKAQATLAQGRQEMKAGRYEKAIALLSQAKEEGADSAAVDGMVRECYDSIASGELRTLVARGDRAFEEKRWAECVKFFEEAAKLGDIASDEERKLKKCKAMLVF